MQSRCASEGTFDSLPKDTLSNLHKDAQEGACEVALKGALKVALELHLLIQWLIHECVQNISCNGGPAAALKGEIDGGLNVGFEWVPFLWKQLKMHNKVTKRMHLRFYLI